MGTLLVAVFALLAASVLPAVASALLVVFVAHLVVFELFVVHELLVVSLTIPDVFSILAVSIHPCVVLLVSVLQVVVLLTDDGWELLDTTALDEVLEEYHLPYTLHVLFCSA